MEFRIVETPFFMGNTEEKIFLKKGFTKWKKYYKILLRVEKGGSKG